MLYDPKWEQKTKADPFTLASVIAWLEKQPATKSYRYADCSGGCLYGQYMSSVRVSWEEARCHFYGPDPHRQFRRYVYDHVAREEPNTFGAALKRARAAQTKGLRA